MHSKVINKKILYFFDLLILALCIALDRITKVLVLRRLKDHAALSALDGILEFRYTENEGAAFSILKGQTSFFIMVFFVVLITTGYFILKSPGRSKYIISHVFISMIIGGAIGNIIDRFLYSAVIDFVYFIFIDFPVFNVADIFSTLGTIGLVISLIFYYKEDDLNFLKFKEKKIREI